MPRQPRPRQPKMADRVSALETQMGEMQSTQEQMQATLQTMAQQMQQQSHVLTELSKQLGRKDAPPVSENSVGDSSQGESRLAGKKVKLPLFEGEDPVAWITRA
ncbi:pentatricopeptide repeat-containing protein, partial [Trifolium medium]|nr:pentatricopeptide repeat-containing protein [Trifolium medium]